MEINGPEIMRALPKLFAMNPLSQEQLQSIILTERLAAAEAKVAELEALLGQSPNGRAVEPVPQAVGS